MIMHVYMYVTYTYMYMYIKCMHTLLVPGQPVCHFNDIMTVCFKQGEGLVNPK